MLPQNCTGVSKLYWSCRQAICRKPLVYITVCLGTPYVDDVLHDREDDILCKLMTGVGSHDDLLKKEISKYDPICAEIADNIAAQEQLLLQIQAQNEQLASVCLEDYKAACEICYMQIATYVAEYQEIKKNINEGLNFYVTLQEAVGKIKQQCSDIVMTRNIQCRRIIEDVQRKLAGFSF